MKLLGAVHSTEKERHIQKIRLGFRKFVPKKTGTHSDEPQDAKKDSATSGKKIPTLFKKLTTGDTEDELAFRKMRNRCKSEIRQWIIRKQATILDLARRNKNVLFKYMRHRRRNKPSAFSLRDRNGEPTSDTTVVSEVYREHYALPYSAPASSSHPLLSRRNYEQPLTDLIFTVEDIRQLLHKINPFCAFAPDEVRPRILKETSSTLTNHLHMVFRQLLDEGRLPSAWKEAIVTPIYKTGDREYNAKLQNWGPIIAWQL
ncbi:hypothetical protein T265_08478 [Opisthorchis viverrini]|uniref:Reverse transcriptase domain-containing protein n=1 Tax=Opisthorchis viverrini TaxID=6198 RepID=A0A074ZDL9_OPIVI|nr:hypothetical protein T265_08478 [Opisthorchis viverrini]KER23712.1 hypothetical protein T265_08478 [Opisthorchis viverrini]